MECALDNVIAGILWMHLTCAENQEKHTDVPPFHLRTCLV
jgi:hypothetical protein